MASLFLQEGNAPIVKVRPLAIFSILDSYRRRNKGQPKVVGTLMGQKVNNIIEIRSAFAVRYSEDESINIGGEYMAQMLALKMSVSDDEVLGSFATTTPREGKLSLTMSYISSFYKDTYGTDLIHLVVDTEMTDMHVGVTAYVEKQLKLSRGKSLCATFQQVKVVFMHETAEKASIDFMMKNLSLSAAKTPAESDALITQNDVKNLETSMQRLLEMLETVSEYVDKASKDPSMRDGSIGYMIETALSSVPRINPAAFNKMFNDSLQDMLMITYLTNLMRTQLAIADKLATCDRMLDECA
jgi:translation initiation factor 3 subunit F